MKKQLSFVFANSAKCTLLCLLVLLNVAATAQQNTVTGTITSSSGNPISGASVTVKGTDRGTSTSATGKFSIVAAPDATLVITSVGYDAKEIEVSGRSDVSISLNALATELEGVVVIGYGTANKRDLTGSIAKVSGKEISDKPNINPVQSLQGKVAGVYVVNSGRPGEAPDVRIRGTNSINGYKPLYIVDGIFNDDISYVNPADIESMEILKDPSSLAIFGLRGANGVIVITTKKAKAGQTIVNVSEIAGFRQVTDKIDMTDAAQFKMLYEEQRANEAADQNNPYVPFDFGKWTANTDWQDEVLHKAFFNFSNISITGSTDKNKFYMSLGYNVENGVVRNETLKKLIVTINDEFKVSNALRFGFNFSGYKSDLPRIHDISASLRAAPVAPTYNESLGLFYAMPSFQAAQVGNPLIDVDYRDNTNVHPQYRTLASIYGQLNLTRNLEFKTTYYIDYDDISERGYSPIVAQYNPVQNHADTTTRSTGLFQQNQTNMKFQQDYLLTYKAKSGFHSLTLLGGFTTLYQEFKWQKTSIQGSQNLIPWDKTKWYVTGDIGDRNTLTVVSPSTGDDTYPWRTFNPAFLFRGLYSYHNKYLLNASFRRDGSSAFYSNGNAWKNFGAIGAGWVLSDENFLRDSKVFDYLKLKGSWGILGNQFTDPRYRYPLYSLLNSTPGVFGENIISGFSPAYLIDPNLHWESIRAYEMGLELNTFNRRLHFEANYYNKMTKDVIVQKPGLAVAGIPPGIFNAGTIANQGFEFLASWTQNINTDWSYSLSANLTTVKNKVISLADNGFELFAGNSITRAGSPIGSFYGYTMVGIYQNDAEIGSTTVLGNKPKPGDIKYLDISGPEGKPDGIIDTKDRSIIGNPTPKGIYGGSFSLSFKKFEFSTDIMGVFGNKIYRAWDRVTYTVPNYAAYQLDRWHGAGTSNTVPILANTRSNNFLPSTFNLEDGSFFRIRNMQLGYTVGAQALAKAHIRSMRIYVNAQNLKTFSHNSGFSPEVGGSAIEFGVDRGTYPLPASYSLGLNLTF